MEKKKTMLSTGVALLLLVGIGLTYAWFSLRINIKSNKDISVKLGTLSLNYVDGSAINAENMEPGWTTNKTITVENTGTKDASYKLIWKELTNEFINDELVVSIECESNTDSCAYINEEENIIASEIGDLSNDVIISPQEIQTIKLTFAFKEMNKNQNYNQGKRFRGIVNIAESTTSGPVLAIFRILDKDGNEVTDKGIFPDSNKILNVQGGYFTELIQYGENTLRLVDTDLNTLDSKTINLSNKKESDIVGNNFYKDIELETITATVVLDENNKISSITNLIVPPESCFTASNNTLQSYTCSDSIKELILPTEINGEEINEIYVNQEMGFITSIFDAKELHKIEIPKTFTQIGIGAFFNSGISHVKISDSVTEIGSSAFANNNLTSVTIPSSVKDIGNYAFANNNLVDVIIPDGVTTINMETFANNNLTSIMIPNSVTEINSSAFENNNLTSITIPNSVTLIERSAFANNKIANINLPDKKISLAGDAFSNNLLPDEKAFIYDRNDDGSENKTKVIAYGGENKTPVIPNNIVAIGNRAFAYSNLENVTIPDSVTTIGEAAFIGNVLKNIIIPDSVTYLGGEAFRDNELISITIPTNIKSIEGGTFRNNKITNITIPDGVTSINNYAFLNNNLTSVTIPKSVTSIGISAFGGNKLRSVTIKEKASSSEFTTYSPNWGWASNISCTTNNTSNVTNGCITWGAN